MRTTLLTTALLVSGITSAATPVDGWYASAFGGYTYVPSHVYLYQYGLFRDNDGYNGGYNAGARYGFQSNPLRYEAEYTYLTANAKHFNVNFQPQTGTTGYTSGNFIMANIYYDTPEMLPAIAPFLGAGIGYGYLKTKLASGGPLGPTYFNDGEGGFAYQGTVGLTYNFAENYAVNVAYRFIATDQIDLFGRSYTAHLASAGAIYRFDQGNYK
jgi:opacity protein-like surface antigen